MKSIHSMTVALALVFVLPAVADAGINDPEVIIYRFPGVLDTGHFASSGVATVFHCTNFSGDNETIRFVTRNDSGALTTNKTFTIPHLVTRTAATHITNAYFQHLDLATDPLFQGTTAIAATSINVICTAMTIDASTMAPVGVALRGIRFSPFPGSQE